MTASALMEQIITILFSGVTQTATSLGSGIVAFINALIYTTPEGATTPVLSSFFTIVLIFAGVSLALSLGYWAISFLTKRI